MSNLIGSYNFIVIKLDILWEIYLGMKMERNRATEDPPIHV